MTVSRFTPSLMEHKDLEAIFVQRQALAQQIVEKIRESAVTPSKHHTLLIGSRGIGKTHLVSLVYHRINNDDCKERLLIAWLREEEWGVTSFLDLLLRIFRALEEKYGNSLPTGSLAERVESLYDLPAETAERAGVALLKEVIAEHTLLLLMENVDGLFEGLGKDGQKQFRSFLQKNSCTVLATAQSSFNGVAVKTSPFYGFFDIENLMDLTADEATQLLANIAKLDGNQDLESFICSEKGRDRIKAVHHLAGGNPRIYVIFSEFLTCESLDQLIEPFMRTLDNLTPYYQARMAWLSPQQRKIVEFLCDRRYPVAVKEIAQRCFMTHQTASSQLKKLLEMDYVRVESIGRESYYELRELLMRFCLEVKKQRGEPISLIANLLRIWYTQRELDKRLEWLSADAVLERKYLLHALQLTEQESQDPRIVAYCNEHKAHLEQNNYTYALQIAEKLVAISHQPERWGLHGCCLSLLKRDNEALVSFDKWIELDPNNALAWLNRGGVLYMLRRFNEALISFDKAIELNPNLTDPWWFRANIMFLFKNFENALFSIERAVILNPNDAQSYSLRSLILLNLNRYDEGLESLDKAIELGEKLSWVFFRRATVLLALNRWDESIAVLVDAIKRFSIADQLNTGVISLMVIYLFNSKNDAAIWRSRISTLIELYDKHQVTSALGQGIAKSIPALMSEMFSDKAARTWLEVWQELTSDRPEFHIPLRLLNAAVRYKETKGDRRVLLELPIEERKLLQPLLGLTEPSEVKKK